MNDFKKWEQVGVLAKTKNRFLGSLHKFKIDKNPFSPKIKTILVTGGAGFIGSTLIDKLLSDFPGINIINIDNFSDFYNPRIKQKNIENHLKNKNYYLYKTDIENQSDLEKIFNKHKIDIVVHLAARAGVRPSIEDPISYVKTNILGTVNILECIKKYQVPKIVFASSSSVYGNSTANKFNEELKLNEPISPYAATKLSCEQIIYTYSKLYEIQAVLLRFFTVFGPRQRPDLAINKFTKLISNNQPIQMFGDGNTVRDYTYIDDIISGVISAIKYDKTQYEIFNLGGGSPVSLKEMINSIEKAIGKKAIIEKLPMQAGDVDKTAADISKARQKLNFNPTTNFDNGIKKFIQWYQLAL